MTMAVPRPSAPGAGEGVAGAAARESILHDDPGYRDVTDKVAAIAEGKMPRWWLPAFLFFATLAGGGVAAIVYLVASGVGVWGLNTPVGWAWDITNFVFWVGIGHAGTLISAILLLLRQRWRMSINRAAEAMTLFAVTCAGLFPLIHVGRLWRIYFTAPVPNHLAIWPNFRSPLLWDVFAVTAYLIVSLLFWYVGLVPDLATMRDRSKGRVRRVIYGLFALGWRGGQRAWHHHEMACLLLAGLATPLVLSVHTVVSFDFAVSQVPGWHTTIFPPYFVAGAILSGFAMVITLMVPIRALFGLQNLVTPRHLENMGKVILATAGIVGFAYLTEIFTAWYSASPLEEFTFFENRVAGPYAWAYWTMITCNVVVPQLFWFRRYRRSPWVLFGVAALINVGMWFERFVIIVTSLHRDALPSSWDMYSPTWVEVLTFVGTFGIFGTLFLVFVRYVPIIAMSEVKLLCREPDPAPPRPPDPVPEEPHGTVGIVAAFPGPGPLKDAARRLVKKGYERFDAHAPFPVHGIDKAMGLPRSGVGWYTLGGAAAGLLLAALLQWYPSAVDYPLITGGKPYASWPAFVPILFELTVLFAAIGTVAGLFREARLPEWYHPALKLDGFLRTSDDGFYLAVDAEDPRFDARATPALLQELGGRELAWLEP